MGNARKALPLAWRMTITDLFGSYGRMALSAVIAILVCLSSYLAMSAFGEPEPLGELLPLITGPAALLTAGFVGFFLNWICRVPYVEWSEASERVAQLERRLRPRISVLTATNHRAESIDYGETKVSFGGTRKVIVSHGPNHLLRLDIANESATPLSGCEAYLARLENLDEDTEPRAWQAIRLQWLRAGKADENGTDIPPSGVRSIALFRVINNRVHLLRDDGVPVHMVNAIKDRGEYHGLVVVSSQNAPTAHIAFSLTCDGPEAAPLLNVLRAAPFDDDDGLFWAREAAAI